MKYQISTLFAREPEDCVKTVYCLCRACRGRRERIEKYHPAFPVPSGGAVDREPRKDDPVPHPEVTHFKAIFKVPDEPVAFLGWLDRNNEIDYGKGVWKI
jgi:hypothetical protein